MPKHLRPKTYTTIQVMPDNAKAFVVRISHQAVLWFVYASVAFVLLIGLLGVVWVKGRVQRQSADHVALLKEREKIHLLEKEVTRLAAQEQKIRNILQTFVFDNGLEATTRPERSRSEVVSQEELREYVELVRQADISTPDPIHPFEQTVVWPVKGILAQRFRSDKIDGKDHKGIDIIARPNTIVVACAKGIVIQSSWQRDLGNHVVVDHGKGFSSTYAHLNRLLVQVGDHVARGSSIGTIGTTGHSLGPHLHFEIRKNGRAVDPEDYLN